MRNIAPEFFGKFDAVVIGGGFYGCVIAHYLATRRRMTRVVVVERESALLKRASYNNQARVHNGYHYPRSFTTAFRSRVNLPKFVHDWPVATRRDFTKLYAIARRNSKVTARQFFRFCCNIGARIETAPPAIRTLFDPRRVEEVFLVEEYAFDADALAIGVAKNLRECGVQIWCNTTVENISHGSDGQLIVSAMRDGTKAEAVSCKYVFNCTYSRLSQLHGDFSGVKTGLKHEFVELALLSVPSELKELAVTVMDGPFFSLMPFPARGLHSLSHVRYSPHFNWLDQPDVDPLSVANAYPRSTQVNRMLRDAVRFLPVIGTSTYVDSLFEVKTVLAKNENDDGRPILFEKDPELLSFYSILGGKIDNVYDVLERLDGEALDSQQ